MTTGSWELQSANVPYQAMHQLAKHPMNATGIKGAFLAQFGQVQGQFKAWEKAPPRDLVESSGDDHKEGSITLLFTDISQDKFLLIFWYYWEG